MKASEVTLGQIFFKGQQNVIPLFQRPYVWSEENNWAPLWDDVRQATEDVMINGAGQGKGQRTYFLGAIVLQDRDQGVGQVDLVNVIDGQQRLTTLQVVFASARFIALDRGFQQAAYLFEELLFNPEKTLSSKYPTDRYKLWPLPQDLDAFLWAVDPENHNGQPVHHKLLNAKSFFTDSIGEWLDRQNDPEQALTHLYETLHKRMQLVQIELNEADDPQVIFEVLNNRGVQLDASDLVKNLLFQMIEKSEYRDNAPSILHHVWLALDGPEWRKQAAVGRQLRSMLDVLLSYWLPTQTGNMTTIEHMFADIKQWMNEIEADPVVTMKSIRRYADLMLELKDLPVTVRTGALIDRMTAIGVNALWPVILYLHGDTTIPHDQREKAILALDSFMMRRMICRYSSNSYSDLVGVCLRAMMGADPSERGEVLESTLLSQTASGRLWPTDAEVREAASSPRFYKAYAQMRSRTLLVSLDNALWTKAVSEAPSGNASGSTWTIEHLLPQEWAKNWRVSQEGTAEEIAQRSLDRQNAVHALGNLTLLTSRLNTITSNRPWEKKRDAISKQALLLLTTQSVLNRPDGVSMSASEWGTDWDEKRIHLRTQWLIDKALELWPRGK